ncbi:MAG: type II toxin-antitoxin system VapC family toxin [Chloroflexi bacterium]|nr:type II toxin-antitoxin system VapC family toxin [Chloroflexota bacterium]
MSAEIAYLDSSAFVKTAIDEAESEALGGFLEEWPTRLSSALLRVEAVRASARRGPQAVASTMRRMTDIVLMPIDQETLELAATLQPVSLRSLDAIHLATAQLLGSDLGVFITYDARLAEGARALGMQVAAPS